MTYKENITAILECYFSGFKKEIIDSACNRILEQEPKTDSWSIKDVADTFKKHGLIRVQEPSGNAINRKLVCAFLSGLISDETERKKALQYINELPSVNPQPCEDAISRENAIIRISWDFPTLEISKVKESLDKLPPVTPQPKTGHWIKRPQGFKCSKCLIIHSHTSIFCPSCGAKMIEPQESEG